MAITAEDWAAIEAKTVAEYVSLKPRLSQMAQSLLTDFDSVTPDKQWQAALLSGLHAYKDRIDNVVRHPDVIAYTAPNGVVTDPLLDEAVSLIGDIPNNIVQAANPAGRSRLSALIDAYL